MSLRRALMRWCGGAVPGSVFDHTSRSSVGTERVYVDGVVQGAPDSRPGLFANWDALYQFAIGNEVGGGAPWLGQVALVAVYCEVLEQAEVTRNFNAGY